MALRPVSFEQKKSPHPRRLCLAKASWGLCLLFLAGCAPAQEPPWLNQTPGPPQDDAGPDAAADALMPSLDQGTQDMTQASVLDASSTDALIMADASMPPATWPPAALTQRECLVDADCTAPGLGRCHDMLGTCVPAPRCNRAWECGSGDPQDVCPQGRCDCVVVDADDELYTGECKRALPVCTPCKEDGECSPASVTPPTARCLPLVAGAGAPRFCLPQREACGAGLRRDERGVCVPMSGHCGQGACGEDADCPGGFCDQGSCALACASADDLRLAELSPCAQGQTCWVERSFLEPRSARFGLGLCRESCKGREEACKEVSPLLSCQEVSETASACRPEQGCLHDAQCDGARNTHGVFRVCDTETYTCQHLCRRESAVDPRTGQPFADCGDKSCIIYNGLLRCS